MSKRTHSADWSLLFLDGKGFYPALTAACTSGMGQLLDSGFMYPEAQIEADRLNREHFIEAQRYYDDRGSPE